MNNKLNSGFLTKLGESFLAPLYACLRADAFWRYGSVANSVQFLRQMFAKSLTKLIARASSAFVLKAQNCYRDLPRLNGTWLNLTWNWFSQTDTAEAESLSEHQRQRQGGRKTRVETIYFFS